MIVPTRIIHVVLACMVVALLLPVSNIIAASQQVEAVRLGHKGDAFRVVVETAAAPDYSLFTLDNPERLVIDLKNTRWRAGEVDASSSLLVNNVRHGPFKLGVLRVVVDLNAPVEVLKHLVISPRGGEVNYRILIDLKADVLVPESVTEVIEVVDESEVSEFSLPDAEDSPLDSQETLPSEGYPEEEPEEVVESLSPQADEMTEAEEVLSETAPLEALPALVAKPVIENIPTPKPRPVRPSEESAPVSSAPVPSRKPVVPHTEVLIKPDASEGAGKITLPDELAGSPAPVPRQKPVRVTRGDKPLVVIDAGHGGQDPGAIGPDKQYEKNLTLRYAKAMKRALEATGRYDVLLTRREDDFLRLRERIAMARKAKGNLFISLHADANPDPSARGLSVYTLSEDASDKEAAMLAQRENKSEILAGMDLSHESDDVTGILIDLAQRETKNKSAGFAAHLVEALKPYTPLIRNTHRFAGFAVLKLPDIPSVLLELGFLSNEDDVKRLQSRRFERQISQAMVKAVDRYFDSR